MPKARKYSQSKRRRYNKTRRYKKTRRGGMKYGDIEEGKYDSPVMFNPTKLEQNKPKIQYNPKPMSREETEKIYEERSQLSNEFDKLAAKYNEDTTRESQAKAYRDSLNNPMTQQEATDFFNSDSKLDSTNECPDKKSCIVSGGNKSRRIRKKRRKSRKN